MILSEYVTASKFSSRSLPFTVHLPSAVHNEASPIDSDDAMNLSVGHHQVRGFCVVAVGVW